jgi:hypothetical protein
MVNSLGKYGTVAVTIAVALMFSTIAYFAIRAINQPVKCGGDTPYTMPDGSCYECPRKDQFNDGTKCVTNCKDPQKRCGDTCYDPTTQKCDADGNVCNELCPDKCCVGGKRCLLDAAASPSPSKKCVDDCKPPKKLDSNGVCCDEGDYSKSDQLCCVGDLAFSSGHCCKKGFAWDDTQNKCSYDCGGKFCPDGASCLTYYSLKDEGEGCIKEGDRYKCSGCAGSSGCTWSGLQNRSPGPAQGVDGRRLACSTDSQPTNDSVPKYCKGKAPLYASAEIEQVEGATCTRADCWQEFSSIFPESQNARPDYISWDNGKCTAAFNTACNDLPQCGDGAWCSGLGVHNAKQCCIGKGNQEGEVCDKDNACHQTSDSEGKICQKIYDPSNCSLLHTQEVRRQWGLTGGPNTPDPGIGYGEVQLPASVRGALEAGNYLQQTNCAGPGAFVLNSPWTPDCPGGECYARKAINPNMVCASPPPQDTIPCNNLWDCVAKVNEQNCWKPNTGSCQDGATYSSLIGMDPNDCRGDITDVDCAQSKDPADGGKRKCTFIRG